MENFKKNAIFYWVALTLFITTLSWLGGKDGGSDEFPVYQTAAMRADPSMLFFELLPLGAVISLIIIAIVGILKYYSCKK